MSALRGTFADFERRKTADACGVRLACLRTLEIAPAARGLEEMGNEFTRAWFDGPFFRSPLVGPSLPQISLVLVQSRDGNTVASDPAALGAGPSDKHLVYEGLSRACADAVMAGARTVDDGEAIFSTWHPELVALRARCAAHRHPTQVVATISGALPIEDALFFNTPEIPVVVLSAGQAAATLVERTRSRPWITVISSGETPDLRILAKRLRQEIGVERISAIGGRTLATSLVDAGLVTDLYLTTSATRGGASATPWYSGRRPPRRSLVVRKRDEDTGAVFEHWVLE